MNSRQNTVLTKLDKLKTVYLNFIVDKNDTNDNKKVENAIKDLIYVYNKKYNPSSVSKVPKRKSIINRTANFFKKSGTKKISKAIT